MDRRVIAVMFGTILALAATVLYVPRGAHQRWFHEEGGTWVADTEWAPVNHWTEFCYGWVWERDTSWAGSPENYGGIFDPGRAPAIQDRVVLAVVAAEQALILLIGGGLMTWVIRRDALKRAARKA